MIFTFSYSSSNESITPTLDRLDELNMDENSKNTNEDASNDAFCSSAETSDASWCNVRFITVI
jgi:hypothetical protein